MAGDAETGANAAVQFRLEGDIPPRPIPFAYRLTLGLTAFAMVLLPLAYVGVIVAAGFGVYFYAIHGIVVFSGSGGGFVKILAYVGPLFAGVTLIAFMIKPLFARPERQTDPLELRLDQHPDLRDLIAAICHKVGAPMPVQVNLDCQVNAAASLRRGLFSLGQRDLVLTIGLPLVAGLSARQFAGVLAHEFGHFAQGGGMAFTYVIRSINGWFGRVVFERDHWDHELEAAGEKSGWQIGVIIALARGAIWLSRRILHGLMYVGHAIACLQLRQMEYDADYYETHLVGTDSFIDTMREINRLSVASHAAFVDLNQLWQMRQLVDNLPELVAVKRGSFDTAVLQKVDAGLTGASTGWLDTHPANSDRIAHARRLAVSGVLILEASATTLFHDFPSLSRETTRHFYRAQLGLTVDESRLVSSTGAERANADAVSAGAAGRRLTHETINLARPVLWTPPDFQPAETYPDLAAIARALAARRAEIDRLGQAARQAESTYGSILEHLLLIEQARALLAAGVKVNPRVFHLQQSDLAEAETERTALRGRLASQAEKLKPFDTTVQAWIGALGRIARTESAPLPAAACEEIIRLTQSLVDLAPWFAAFPERHHRHFVVSVFIANQGSLRENRGFQQEFNAQLDALAADVAQALAQVGSAPFPFAAANGVMSAADVLRHALEGIDGPRRLVVVLETTASSYYRILGRLAALGEELEKSVAPPPLPS